MNIENIIFRGKNSAGSWVYGSFIYADEYCCILEDESKVHPMDWPYLDPDLGTIDGKATPIIPETVGMWTGYKDKDGRMIFEGDIVKSDWGYKGIVDFEDFIYSKLESCISDDIEVIGNIWDNPDLAVDQ